MTTLKRPLAATGAAALLALSLTACGGSPADASTEDFCSSLEEVFAAMGSVDGEQPSEDEFTKIQEAFEELGDTGTPDGIGDAERNGFETMVDAITGLDYHDAKESFDSGDVPGVSEGDEEDIDAFEEYADKTCSEGSTPDVEDTPSIDPSDIPSIDPSDVPSVDLGDLDPEDLASMQAELEELTEGIPTE